MARERRGQKGPRTSLAGRMETEDVWVRVLREHRVCEARGREWTVLRGRGSGDVKAALIVDATVCGAVEVCSCLGSSVTRV